jgi:hypothetical protein
LAGLGSDGFESGYEAVRRSNPAAMEPGSAERKRAVKSVVKSLPEGILAPQKMVRLLAELCFCEEAIVSREI